jgi:hypothetical protein
MFLRIDKQTGNSIRKLGIGSEEFTFRESASHGLKIPFGSMILPHKKVASQLAMCDEIRGFQQTKNS